MALRMLGWAGVFVELVWGWCKLVCANVFVELVWAGVYVGQV